MSRITTSSFKRINIHVLQGEQKNHLKVLKELIYYKVSRKTTSSYKRIHIHVLQGEQKNHLKFDVCLAADGNVAADVGVVAVLLQKLNVANENLAQPLEDLGVVENLMLDQLLRDGEQHLRTEQKQTPCTCHNNNNNNKRTISNAP